MWRKIIQIFSPSLRISPCLYSKKLSFHAGSPQLDQTWMHVPSILGPSWDLSYWSRAIGCIGLQSVMFLSWSGAGLVHGFFLVDVAIKPLQPTSTGQTIAFQPRCSNAMHTAAFSSHSLHQLHPPRVLSSLWSSQHAGCWTRVSATWQKSLGPYFSYKHHCSHGNYCVSSAVAY